MPVHVGEAEIPAGVEEGEFFVIEAELMQNGVMQTCLRTLSAPRSHTHRIAAAKAPSI